MTGKNKNKNKIKIKKNKNRPIHNKKSVHWFVCLTLMSQWQSLSQPHKVDILFILFLMCTINYKTTKYSVFYKNAMLLIVIQ